MAKGGDHGLNGHGARGLICDVAGKAKMRLGRSVTEASHCSFCGCTIDVENCDPCSFGCKPPGRCETYSTG
jgi:hypothetical protein